MRNNCFSVFYFDVICIMLSHLNQDESPFYWRSLLLLCCSHSAQQHTQSTACSAEKNSFYVKFGRSWHELNMCVWPANFPNFQTRAVLGTESNSIFCKTLRVWVFQRRKGIDCFPLLPLFLPVPPTLHFQIDARVRRCNSNLLARRWKSKLGF